MRDFVSTEFLLSLFPRNLSRLLPPPSILQSQGVGAGEDSVCSFVKNRENPLTNLGPSPKLHKWKPVTTNIRLSFSARDRCSAARLKRRVVSVIHVCVGWDGKPWGMVLLRAKKNSLTLERIRLLCASHPVLTEDDSAHITLWSLAWWVIGEIKNVMVPGWFCLHNHCVVFLKLLSPGYLK